MSFRNVFAHPGDCQGGVLSSSSESNRRSISDDFDDGHGEPDINEDKIVEDDDIKEHDELEEDTASTSRNHEDVDDDGGAAVSSSSWRRQKWELNRHALPDEAGKRARGDLNDDDDGDSEEEKRKRKRVLCEFYVKGWCVRGASCGFSHEQGSPPAMGNGGCCYPWKVTTAGGSLGYKIKLPVMDWEPSVPFRPILFGSSSEPERREMAAAVKVNANHQARAPVAFFRTALIDHVKELIKPSWHKGCLSRDNYKRIVKKTVEKVLTHDHHQLPTTPRAAKQYLLSSHHKITRLIEGYVDKYAKL